MSDPPKKMSEMITSDILLSAILIDQFFVQLSSEKLPLAAHRKSYKDPQPVRFLHSKSEEAQGEGKERL